MPKTFLRSLLGAAILLSVLAAGALARPPRVTLRVEGVHRTLLPTTTVNTTSTDRIRGQRCSGSTAAGALDRGTHGRWSGKFSLALHDFFVDTILREHHNSASEFWALWVNNRSSQTGVCNTKLHSGDRVLFIADTGGKDRLPLGLSAPARVRAGVTFTVRVVRYDDGGRTQSVGGAVVPYPGVSSVPTNAKGLVHVRVPRSGVLHLTAYDHGYAPSDSRTVRVLTPRSARGR